MLLYFSISFFREKKVAKQEIKLMPKCPRTHRNSNNLYFCFGYVDVLCLARAMPSTPTIHISTVCHNQMLSQSNDNLFIFICWFFALIFPPTNLPKYRYPSFSSERKNTYIYCIRSISKMVKRSLYFLFNFDLHKMFCCFYSLKCFPLNSKTGGKKRAWISVNLLFDQLIN